MEKIKLYAPVIFSILGLLFLYLWYDHNKLIKKCNALAQANMDRFQKIVKSSADKDETAKQFYDNYFVKEVPDSFYISTTTTTST